jgi:hypothetical protein
VAWVTQGGVLKAMFLPILPCAMLPPPSVLATGVDPRIAIDSSGVYFASDGGIYRASVNGGHVQQIGSGNCCVALDSSGIYWATGDTIQGVGRDNGTPAAIVPAPGVRYLLVDRGTLYWLDETGAYSAEVDGGKPTLLGPAGGSSSLALDARNVYWVGSTGALMIRRRCP